jgi:hypothetical protein
MQHVHNHSLNLFWGMTRNHSSDILFVTGITMSPSTVDVDMCKFSSQNPWLSSNSSYLVLVVLHQQERELRWYFRQGGLYFSHGTTDAGRDDKKGEPAKEGIQCKEAPDKVDSWRVRFLTRRALSTRRPSPRREWMRKIEKITFVIHDAVV